MPMPRRKKFAWEKLSDEQLLKRRLSSLRVTLEGTWLEDCLDTLYEELEERGIRLRPHAWISSEWFSPSHVPGIAVPFYLAHPRLMKLEKKMMLDVEGGTWSECMAILRHEAGHAVQHAYQLQRRRRWQQLFGPSSKHYPALLPAQSGQPPLCPASSALVCAEPSGRGLRRNLRGMAAAAFELADALCRLAGAEEARICRRADGRNRRQTAAKHDARAARSAA